MKILSCSGNIASFFKKMCVRGSTFSLSDKANKLTISFLDKIVSISVCLFMIFWYARETYRDTFLLSINNFEQSVISVVLV